MSKELIISANVHEKKVAVLEDGVVTEFYVERRDENQGVVGNLYKGRVMKVLPGMQSAFVDIGLDRDAFLYVSDFTEFMEEEEEVDFREVSEEQRARAGIEDGARRGERPRPLPARGVQVAEPVIERPQVERPVPIEDAVEQLAEIAHESLIPPPPPEEELPEHEPAAQPAPAEAQVQRVTDEEESLAAAEKIEQPPQLKAEPEVKRGRGRRRKAETEAARPKRRPPKAEEKEAKAAAKKTTKGAGKRSKRVEEEPAIEPPAEASPQELGPQFERVTDEDFVIQEAGELLKDAIVQEKIIEQVHTAEFQTAAVPPQPEPEWRVGTLRSVDGGESAFQRVVDENSDAGTPEEVLPETAAIELQDEGKVSPFRHISDVVRGLYDRIGYGAAETAEPSSESAASHVSETEEYQASATSLVGTTTQGSESRQESAHEEDREAEVRERYPRAEFAVRRGGRGRRGRGVRRDATTTTAQPEEATADTPREEVEGEEAQPGPPRPVDARGNLRRGRRPNQRRPDQRRVDQPPPRRRERGGPSTISELLHEGQEILVQIAKEPIAKKGARITSHIALPGRFIVYMPTVNHIGVSRKIPNEVERVRLKRIVTGLRDREGATGGFIARTACAGHSEQELADDMRYLLRTWADLRKKAER